MIIREPVVAGQFYPAQPDRCRAELLELLAVGSSGVETGKRLLGGLVPHAGWLYSGTVAAKVFNTLKSSRLPDVIVLVGGVHRHHGREAALFSTGRWETPLGPVDVDNRLAERILGYTNLIVDDAYAHENEHSIEVQMPFVKHLFPKAKVVPIMVPVTSAAHEVGEALGRTLSAYKYDALIVGTTDLTHYGPHYGFIPQGIGAKANAWAKEINDRRFIDLVCALKSTEVVPEAIEHKNACASGATAATLAAVTLLGATKGVLLDHTTSDEALAGQTPGETHDSVGYAAVVFD
ncbi:MAG: AmmeMemoRadiSam system protein B [Phycisphaerae bacterium]